MIAQTETSRCVFGQWMHMDKQFLCDMLANCTLFSAASFPGLPCLQFLIACYCKQSITGGGEGLGTGLVQCSL